MEGEEAARADSLELLRRTIVKENPHCAQLFLAAATDSALLAAPPRRLRDEDRYLESLPRMPYRWRPDSERSSCHWGQLKLFESELKCLTDLGWVSKDDFDTPALEADIASKRREQPLVLYVGAAPGRHVPAMVRRFPRCRFELFDPADFDPALHEFAASPQAGGRVQITQDFFNDAAAAEISQRGLGPIVLVSDVRTANEVSMSHEEVEQCIERDMQRQRSWVEALRPATSLLKFRLPWSPGSTSYLRGKVLVQAFPPCTSTETRLLVTPGDLEAGAASYDHDEYQEKLMHHNTIRRAQLHDIGLHPTAGAPVGASAAPGISHAQSEAHDVVVERSRTPEVPVVVPAGLDACFDCAALVATVRNYLACKRGVPSEAVATGDVMDEIASIVSEITESGRTLATKYHVSSSRHRGRHFAKRRYVDAFGHDSFSVARSSRTGGIPSSRPEHSATQ